MTWEVFLRGDSELAGIYRSALFDSFLVSQNPVGSQLTLETTGGVICELEPAADDSGSVIAFEPRGTKDDIRVFEQRIFRLLGSLSSLGYQCSLFVGERLVAKTMGDGLVAFNVVLMLDSFEVFNAGD